MASVEKLINENTIGLVGIAGNTEFGQIDPIDKLSEVALENELFLHVDAVSEVLLYLPGKAPAF